MSGTILVMATTHWQKNGQTKTARTPAQAVALKFDGYRQIEAPAAGEVTEVQPESSEPNFADAQNVFDVNGESDEDEDPFNR